MAPTSSPFYPLIHIKETDLISIQQIHMIGLAWAGRICRTFVVLLPLGLAAQSDNQEPFGLATAEAPVNSSLWVTWQNLQAEIQSEKAIIAYCRAEPASCGSQAALRFIAIVNEGTPYEGLHRIGRINRAVNYSIRVKNQTSWTSPLATLAMGEGDCKQYTILKYAAMSDAGIALDDLRLILGNIKSKAIGHSMVAVRHAGNWLILDNRSLQLVESNHVPDYQPVYALDHRGVRRFVLPQSPEIAGLPCDDGIG